MGLSGFSLKREWAHLSEQNDVQHNFTSAISLKQDIAPLSEFPWWWDGAIARLATWWVFIHSNFPFLALYILTLPNHLHSLLKSWN